MKNNAQSIFSLSAVVIMLAFVTGCGNPIAGVNEITATERFQDDSGYNEYRRLNLSIQFTDEERAYLHSNPVVRLAAEADNYPVSFFNFNDRQWNGIIHDVLHEIEILTGLTFEIVNDNTAGFSDLVELLEKGEVSIISEMIRTREREDRFIWAETLFMEDRSVLISKFEYPRIRIDEISNKRVGAVRGSAHDDLFKSWFPDHENFTKYDNMHLAMEALYSNEIDLLMERGNHLLRLTHYEEHSGFKINIVFDNYFFTTFGFNKNETVLRSIIDKSLALIDTKAISEYWKYRTFDYRYKILEAQRPWLISAAVLSLLVLALVLLMFLRSKKRAAERIIAYQQVETANRAKYAFLASMNHELRTPLNSTINMIREAISTAENKKTIEALHHALSSSNDLLSVLTTILEISNIESGELVLSNTPFAINGVADDIDKFLSTLCRAKGIVWEQNVDIPENLLVNGDRLRLMQALTILLRNAVDYAGEKNGRVGFTIKLLAVTEDTASVLFQVCGNDTGRNAGKSEIMLSACNIIVKAMGSQISVKSRPGTGSCFSFTLDFARAAMDVQQEKVNLDRLDFTGKQILVVDDIEVNRAILKNILSIKGAEIVEASDGKEAVEIFLTEPENIDLILMDIMMPDMNGYEAARAIRFLEAKWKTEKNPLRRIPIIAVTALTYREDRDAVVESGMDFHLKKPVEPEALLSCLARFL